MSSERFVNLTGDQQELGNGITISLPPLSTSDLLSTWTVSGKNAERKAVLISTV